MPRFVDATIGSRAGSGILATSHSRQPGRAKPMLRIVLSVCLLQGAVGRGAEPPVTTGAGSPTVSEPVSATAADDSAAPRPTEAEVETLRAETIERLKAFQPAASAAVKAVGTSPSPAASVKPPICELLEERRRLLDEYDEATRALHKITHAETSPERQAADARDELRELEAVSSRAAGDPDTLLPPLFLRPSVESSRTLPAEMKAALETTSINLQDARNKLETLRGEVARSKARQETWLVERDKLFQGLTNLKAKREGYDLAVTDAPTVEARKLARERQVNFEWTTRVRSLQLQLLESEAAQEATLADVRALKIQAARLQIQIGVKTQAQMNKHYRALAQDQQSRLNQRAAKEEEAARHPGDPLEQFRARRSAELLKLEAVVLKYELAQATAPSPSYEEQKTLADRADGDFHRIEKLLDDGSVSRLDAIRLNNEFRRISPERERLAKNELATIEAQIHFYENELTNVEIELMQGTLHDFENDLIRERLPQSRRKEGEELLTSLENRHRALLIRKRDALEALSTAGGHTLGQVVRRLAILDEEYGFIRTHIFWVRDQEPIGLETLTQDVHEFHYLVKALARLARESIDVKRWSRPSAEFLVTALAVLALPAGLVRLRRRLGTSIEHDSPAPRA